MTLFNFTFDPGTTIQQMVGFEMAGRVWSTYLSDAVTINLHVGMSSGLPTNVIGGALPGFQANRTYTTVRDRLYADATSADDTAATNGIRNYNKYSDFANVNGVDPTTRLHATYDFFLNKDATWYDGTAGTTWNQWYSSADRITQNGQTYVDVKDNFGGTTMALTRANAKALGVSLEQATTALDGYILMSNLSNTSNVVWNYDYTRSSAAGSNSLDFFSVVLHEIGHTLGFVSSVDRTQWVSPFFTSTNAANVVASIDFANYSSNANSRSDLATPLDLFRYTQTNANWAGWRDFSVGGATMFSFDGTTAIANFATGMDTSLGGSGLQASHWQGSGTSSGIMNPTLGLGIRRNVSTLDLRAFDAIGWNLRSGNTALNLDLSALRTQSIHAVASRAGRGSSGTTATTATTWYNTNLTASSTQTSLVRARDQEVYDMMANSQIYDMTRVASTSTTTTVTRMTFAQAFAQQQGFRSELVDLGSGASVLEISGLEISGALPGITEVQDPLRSPAQPSFAATTIMASVPNIVRFYMTLLDPLPTSGVSSDGQAEVAPHLSEALAIAPPNTPQFAAPLQTRDYDSKLWSSTSVPSFGTEQASTQPSALAQDPRYLDLFAL
jgi:hypothetical protein